MVLVFLIIRLLLIYFPFLITPEVGEKGRGGGRGIGRHRSQVGAPEQRLAQAGPGISIMEARLNRDQLVERFVI